MVLIEAGLGEPGGQGRWIFPARRDGRNEKQRGKARVLG